MLDTRSVSLLGRIDHAFISLLVPLVPRWLRSHHLTLLTLVWSALIVGFSVLAQSWPRALWWSSVVILLQYVTDALDGKVGRLRDEGLVRWGFYVDHFLDYVFLSAVLFGYTVLVPPSHRHWMLAIMALSGAFMVSVFLERAVVGRLRLSVLGIGPFEIRLVFIAINTVVLSLSESQFLDVLPWVIGIAFIVLAALVIDTQARLWRADMKEVIRRADGQTVAAEMGATTPPGH